MRDTAADSDSLIAEEYRKRLQRSERGYWDPEYKPEAVSLDFDPMRSSVQLIAYYLPQFYLIPENEEAWGRGFTEWTNVTRALPQFAGHYQPHLPSDLGFYDLSNEEALERQVALARKYGISGFCIHYYWFGGKRLLEKPVATLYRRKDLDIRFCLCWANETWSRRWDGSEDDVLVPQIHTPESEKQFIEDAVRYMDDPRYLTIDGRPVLVVYRSELLVDPERTIEHWRNVALRSVGKDLFLLRGMTFQPTVHVNGFDAAVQFPPHHLDPGDTSASKALFNSEFSGRIYEYPALLSLAKRQLREYDFPVIPTAMPGWDNTPRRGGAGSCFHGSTPAHYAAWLTEAAAFAKQNPVGGSSYVFINAWNEWAEGAHLEPDQKFGHAYLRATVEVLRPYCEIEARSRGALPGDASTELADRASKAATPATTPALQARTCVLVAGMHRSGTSATTRVINLLGADIASDLVDSIPGDNDRGFWESATTYALHDRLFASLDSAWDDPYPLPDGWRESGAARAAKRAIRAHIEMEFADSRMFVVKDPRATRVLSLWLEALDELSIEPVVVIPFRHPIETALSLERRDRLPLAQSLLCYIQSNLEVERASRGRQRVFQLYDDLISDWRPFAEKLANIGGPAGKGLHPAVTGEIDRFLSADLRHHQAASANFASLPAEAATLAEMHDRMLQASSSGDETSLRACFDRIRERMRDAPKLFRAVASVKAEAHRDEIASVQADAAAEVERRDAELDVLRSQLRQHQAKADERAEELRQQGVELASALASRMVEVHAVRASTSWRVTEPLRLLGMRLPWLARLGRLALPPAVSPALEWPALAYAEQGTVIVEPERTREEYDALDAEFYLSVYPDVAAAVARGEVASAWEHYYRHGREERRLTRESLSYAEWVRSFDTLTGSDIELIRANIVLFKRRPEISIALIGRGAERGMLRRTLNSCFRQLYPDFEIIIADRDMEVFSDASEHAGVKLRRVRSSPTAAEDFNTALESATGEFLIVMEAGDTLAPCALYLAAHSFLEHPQLQLIYADEDEMTPAGGRKNPFFKSAWNPELILGLNYIGKAVFFRTELLRSIGGASPEAGDGWQWDVILRAAERATARAISRIPFVLYHEDAPEERRRREVAAGTPVVGQSLARRQQSVTLAHDPRGWLSLKRHLPNPAPHVTIIIPTRDRCDLLKRCVEGVLKRTTYPGFDLTVVDNRSEETETIEYLQLLRQDSRVSVISYEDEFNFAKIHNEIVGSARGEFVVLLNNDVDVITGDWLEVMVGHALDPGVGVVGAKLYFPDGKIQHAGVVVGLGGVAGHVFHRANWVKIGPAAMLTASQDMSAVTGACMLFRRSVFAELHGFDEAFAVDFNDIDFCLRAQEQVYRVVWAADAELYLLERATSGTGQDSENPGQQAKQSRFRRETARFRERWMSLIKDDPYYNPNLSLTLADRSLAVPPRVERPWLLQEARPSYGEKIVRSLPPGPRAHDAAQEGGRAGAAAHSPVDCRLAMGPRTRSASR
jgi:GT2 family glycosyltransferase